MTVTIRILLFFFCIIILIPSLSNAVQDPFKTPLILEKDYVLIEASNTQSPPTLILQNILDITQYVQVRFYSLLNWVEHTRRQPLQIESYDRPAQFGRWINDPNDDVCFNTRAKVLVRDSKKAVVFKDTNHCVVESGSWNDPYTKTTFSESSEIQIDHLVPLKNAYLSGAYKWNFRARCLYANYLGEDFHLLSVSGTENMKKGERTPAEYMPPNSSYACTYVRNWLAVKMLWGLTMTVAEADAISEVLSENDCAESDFRISAAELKAQRQFVKDNIDLCEKIDKTNQ